MKLDKIATHSFEGYIFFIKRTILDQYNISCTIHNCKLLSFRLLFMSKTHFLNLQNISELVLIPLHYDSTLYYILFKIYAGGRYYSGLYLNNGLQTQS